MSVRFIWTEEMVAYIVVKRTAFQWSWKRVSEGFNRKFGTKKSEQSMSSYYRNNILAGNNTFSQEEIDFLHGCFLNNFPFKKTETAFKEYFSKPLKRKSYEWVIKNCESTHVNLQLAKAISKEIEETKNKLVKNMKTRMSRKGIHNKKWTEKEHKGLFTITSGKELTAYAEKIGKSSGAVRQRMANHKISLKENKKATKKPTKKGLKKGRMTKVELELILNCKTVEEALALNLRKPETIIRQFAKFNSMKKPPVKLVKKEQNKNYYRLWTAEETAQLMKCKTRKDVVSLARELNRSENSAYSKWFVAKGTEGAVKEMVSKVSSLKKKALDVKTPKKTTKPKKKYTPRWTDEEDYDLICNFYDLSIDEATIRFNRSYGAIASRLEKIVDSTQPKHKAMLMKAAVEIKSRKRAMSKPVKLSRRERRMARKQAKLAKRIAKLKGKMQG
tara:strand:+ start:546 stop:1880 length:1335 start_codon:yes stop_codon:yes gene_type:complete